MQVLSSSRSALARSSAASFPSESPSSTCSGVGSGAGGKEGRTQADMLVDSQRQDVAGLYPTWHSWDDLIGVVTVAVCTVDFRH